MFTYLLESAERRRWETETERDRETDTGRDRHRERETETETDRQTDRQRRGPGVFTKSTWRKNTDQCKAIAPVPWRTTQEYECIVVCLRQVTISVCGADEDKWTEGRRKWHIKRQPVVKEITFWGKQNFQQRKKKKKKKESYYQDTRWAEKRQIKVGELEPRKQDDHVCFPVLFIRYVNERTVHKPQDLFMRSWTLHCIFILYWKKLLFKQTNDQDNKYTFIEEWSYRVVLWNKFLVFKVQLTSEDPLRTKVTMERMCGAALLVNKQH